MAARCRFIASVLQQGRMRPTALPSAGQMAPKMEVEAVRWSCGASGTVFRFKDVIALRTQAGPKKPPNRRLVINDKHPHWYRCHATASWRVASVTSAGI